MGSILFDNARPIVETDPARADVACFVGLAVATGTALPPAIPSWLRSRGWLDGPLARPITPPFTDLPIPIENYSVFTSLFDVGGSDASFGTDYLAAAVRSFFAQGGRRCYVIRMDSPVTPQDSPASKQDKLSKLLPGDLYAVDDPRSWHGVGHLGGLPDVSLLALPDLAVLCASAPTGAKGVEPKSPTGPEQFVECLHPADAPKAKLLFTLPAPRLSPDDYKIWARAAGAVLSYLSRNFRELQFVAAFPLPQDLDAAAAAETPSSDALAHDVQRVVSEQMPELPGQSLSTAFLQLSYPWLKTTGSHVLLESLEPPDGALVGILARNALARGAFMDATKVVPAEIFDVWPSLPSQETTIPSAPLLWDGGSQKPLIVRLSLFGFTPAGMRLLSDVTAYPGESYRPARVHRLISVISRAARRLGEQMVFDADGPALWNRVQRSLQQLMTRLWKLNALEGDTPQAAFSVRCDASTMTQNDLDNGRLIAQITFTAAATIELISVTVALQTSGAGVQGAPLIAGVG
jgi:hypothetical protein